MHRAWYPFGSEFGVRHCTVLLELRAQLAELLVAQLDVVIGVQPHAVELLAAAPPLSGELLLERVELRAHERRLSFGVFQCAPLHLELRAQLGRFVAQRRRLVRMRLVRARRDALLLLDLHHRCCEVMTELLRTGGLVSQLLLQRGRLGTLLNQRQVKRVLLCRRTRL
jgi:hypothetical protein